MLEVPLASKKRRGDQTLMQRLQPNQGAIPDLQENVVDLKAYDQLLSVVVSGD